jgi:hypothetical protein
VCALKYSFNPREINHGKTPGAGIYAGMYIEQHFNWLVDDFLQASGNHQEAHNIFKTNGFNNAHYSFGMSLNE